MQDLFPSSTLPVRNISNSEVTTFLSCKRQYKYAFVWELTPKDTSDPLARGSVFHKGMEFYWRARMEGKSHEDAIRAGQVAFEVLPEGYSLQMLMHAQFLWTRFVNYHNGWPDWEPLGTEIKLTVPMTPNLHISIQYDFYYLNKPTNKRVLLDWKVTYEFWNVTDHALNGQMPKYIAVLQANGFQVDEGSLAEIRSRPLGKEKSADPKNLWRYSRYNPTAAKKRAVLTQHLVTSTEIEKFRALSPEEQREEAQPVLNKYGACKFCDFTDLCTAELEGRKDLTVDIRVGYIHNTYTDIHNEKPEPEKSDFRVNF